MQFVKSGEVYKVARITGVQDNFLGVTLAEHPAGIELVAFPIPGNASVKASPEEVLKQVIEGLSEVNLELGKDYRLAKVFYSPQENPSNAVYKLLISELIRRIDASGVPEGNR